jgi:hypothetical protein
MTGQPMSAVRALSARRVTPTVATMLLLGVLSLAATAAAQEAPPPPKPHGPALFAEPGFMTSALDWADRFSSDGESSDGKKGFYPKVGGMITGAGWLAIGPGYRTRLFDDRAVIDALAQVSLRGYLSADASVEVPLLLDGRLAVGAEALWQDSTQVNYFGLGPDSSRDLRSQYRLQTLNVVGYGRYRPERWLALSGRFGWLDGPSVASATGPFNRDYLDAQATFPNDPAMTIAEKPQFFHSEVAVTADTRDYPGHPTRGALYRASVGVYADRDLDAFSLRRYELEGAQFIPLFNDAWIIALHGWGVFSDPDAGHEVPFYLTPSLGGANTLRGYPNYRFHDRHLLLASAESRWPLFQHIDAAVFLDSGTVAANVADLGFDKTTYGVGFRVHSHSATTARVDIARGREGWQVLLRLNDPFNLRRLARWSAAVPFAP